MDIHLGLIRAQMLELLPRGSPGRDMHSGIPEDPGQYHVNVSLLAEDSRAPINDPRIQMHLV
jgi:hypothetical protein